MGGGSSSREGSRAKPSSTSTSTSTMAYPQDITPEEFSKLPLLERLTTYNWKIEIFALGVVLAYFVLFKLGSGYNNKIASKFIDSVVPALRENFFQVGVTSQQLYAQDDGQHYSLYASGRLRVQSVLAKIELQSRQNLFMWAMELVMSFFLDSVPPPQDLVTVQFTFDEEASEKFDNFVWAVVTKDKMNTFRSENYFLSLTKTSESPKLPLQFVFMNEVSDMNDVLYTKKLADLLQANVSTLKFLAITDQPVEKPFKIAELKPYKRLILQFALSNSDSNIEAIKNLFNYVLNEYLDLVVNRATFRPELTRKVKKTRENEYNKLKKILDDLKREELNTKKIEEQKKLKASMTPEEQQKFSKKQQERKQRKQLNRQKVRGSM